MLTDYQHFFLLLLIISAAHESAYGGVLESVEITSSSISFDYQLMTEVEFCLVVCTFGLSPNSNCCTDVRLS